MRNKPSIVSQYSSNYLDITVNLSLDCNICFVIGDSGEGKSFLWQVFSDDSSIMDYVLTYNYKDINKELSKRVMEAKNKLIVIDNADILLDIDLRRYIAFDTDNQYILFGRNPECLFLVKENFKEIRFQNKEIVFESAF